MAEGHKLKEEDKHNFSETETFHFSLCTILYVLLVTKDGESDLKIFNQLDFGCLILCLGISIFISDGFEDTEHTCIVHRK